MDGLNGEHVHPFFRARLRYDERYRLELEQARAYGKSHSVFTGRVIQPGDPEFLAEDTDGAIALAEEERATCPDCGLLKVWCRDPVHQFSFDVEHSVCWPSQRSAQERGSPKFQGYDDATKSAVQLSTRFKPGVEPDLSAGLDLPERGSEPDQDAQNR